MKKITISILLLLTVSFLSWCSIDWNWEKDKKIVKLEKQLLELNNKENEFKKNQECIRLKDSMEKSITNILTKTYESQEILSDINKWIIKIKIWDIFYSRKLNSCVFWFIKTEDLSYFFKEKFYSHNYYIINNTNNIILFNSLTLLNWDTVCYENWINIEPCNDEKFYNTKLIKLKWE